MVKWLEERIEELPVDQTVKDRFHGMIQSQGEKGERLVMAVINLKEMFKDVTNIDLAHAVGIHKGNMGRILSGQETISPEIAFKMVKFAVEKSSPASPAEERKLKGRMYSIISECNDALLSIRELTVPELTARHRGSRGSNASREMV